MFKSFEYYIWNVSRNYIDSNIGSQCNVKWFFFWFSRITQKRRVNEMEQEDKYVNAFDFLNNF